VLVVRPDGVRVDDLLPDLRDELFTNRPVFADLLALLFLPLLPLFRLILRTLDTGVNKLCNGSGVSTHAPLGALAGD
jgi:hypothetical protein